MGKREEIVKELLELGVVSTEEEAVKYAIENGYLTTDSSGTPFLGSLPELKLHNGYRTGGFNLFSKEAKKKKINKEFIEGHFYIGSKIVKDKETKDFDFDKTEMGLDAGDSPRFIPVVRIWKCGFFNPEMPNLTVNTLTARTITKDAQNNELIDVKSKKSVPELYQTGKYSKEENSKTKIKFIQIVGGLVETDDGWKAVHFPKTLGKFENDTFNQAFDGKLPYSMVYQLETKDGPSSLIFELSNGKKIDPTLFKELKPLIEEIQHGFNATIDSHKIYAKQLRGEVVNDIPSQTVVNEEENKELDDIFGEEDDVNF